MQKGRILLLFLIFPIVSSLIIFMLRQDTHLSKTKSVLAAKTIQTILTPTFAPSTIPTNTSTPTPTVKKKTLPTLSPSFSPLDYISQEINIYRQQKGLSKATSNTETCSFAKIRAEEISNTFTHDGFNNRVTSKNLPYPSYQEVTENIAYNTDYTDVVKRWIASPGHEENLRKDTPFICIAKYGDYYVFEGWRP